MTLRANKGKGNILDRDEWQTPQELWDKLNKQYKFTFDCCANDPNSKCLTYSSDFKITQKSFCDNFICWMNPPFSKALEMFKHFFTVVEKGVAIYRGDNLETQVWQKIILPEASWIFIPDKRINYEGMNGKGSVFPSALIGLNVEPPQNLKGVTLVKQ